MQHNQPNTQVYYTTKMHHNTNTQTEMYVHSPSERTATSAVQQAELQPSVSVAEGTLKTPFLA